MLKIRLQRYGRTNDPSFRVVVLEGTEGPKSGNHVEQIGFYNAVTKQKSLDTERAKYWIGKGAQPTDTVYNMLVAAGAVAGKKRNVLPKKTPIVKEPVSKPPAEATPTAEPSVEAPAQETVEATLGATSEVPAEAVPGVSVEETVEETPTDEPKTE